jgi:pimeloyl-ACP methyl ester carboxylesterase
MTLAQPLAPDLIHLRAPEDVPSSVSREFLISALSSARPKGELERLEVQGLSTPMVTVGEGRPVLFVHGLGHDMWDWAPVFERRPEGSRYRALDLPGFGLSDKPAREYPLDLMVDAVLAAARDLGSAPLCVGSSLGGHIAMLAALRRPEAFAGLLLVSTGGLEKYPMPARALARTYYSYAAIRARAERDILGNSRRIFAGDHAAREELAARKLCIHRSTERAAFARPFASVVADVLQRPVAERVAELSPVTRLLHGEKDVVVPLESVKKAADRFSLSLTVLDGIGHLPMVESPDAFHDHLVSFVDELFGGL